MAASQRAEGGDDGEEDLPYEVGAEGREADLHGDLFDLKKRIQKKKSPAGRPETSFRLKTKSSENRSFIGPVLLLT